MLHDTQPTSVQPYIGSAFSTHCPWQLFWFAEQPASAPPSPASPPCPASPPSTLPSAFEPAFPPVLAPPPLPPPPVCPPPEPLCPAPPSVSAGEVSSLEPQPATLPRAIKDKAGIQMLFFIIDRSLQYPRRKKGSPKLRAIAA